MKSLNSNYIYDYAIDESLSSIYSDSINEGKIVDSIKKLWNWIMRKNNKKKENTSSDSKIYGQSLKYDNYIEDEPNIEISEYSFSKLKQTQLKAEMKKSKNIIQTNNENIKILVAKDNDNGQIAGILTFVNGDDSPIAKRVDKFKNYAHIYSLELNDDYREKGIGRMLIAAAKKKMESESTSQSKGFTIDTKESNSKKIYKNIGFTKPYHDYKSKIDIMYVKYEDINTDY